MTLYRQSIRKLYIDYETPDNAVGENVLMLNITGAGLSRIALINFTISDRIPPVIESITIPDNIMSTVRFPIDAKITDNIDVNRTLLDIECSGYSENNIG